MGWAYGTEVCESIWKVVRKHVPDKEKAAVLAKVIDALTDVDWDCIEEIEDTFPEAKEAIKIYNDR